MGSSSSSSSSTSSPSRPDGRKARATQRRNLRREQILAAARKMISVKGYHACSVADILSEAQIARGTFYLYFPSKRAIFEALLDQMLSQITGALRRIRLEDSAETPLEQMYQNVVRIFGVLEDNRELTIILLREAVGLDNDFDQKLDAFYQRLSLMIQGALQLGQSMNLVRPCNVQLVSHCVMGSIKEVILGFLTSPPTPELNRETLAREVLEYNLKGVFL